MITTEYWYRLKESFWKIPKREWRDVIITILIVAFIFAYDDKAPAFTLSHWLYNFFRVLIAVALVVFVHESGHQLWAIWVGYRYQYRIWFTGLMIGLLFTFITHGKWYILLVGGATVHMIEKRRIGHFRHGIVLLTQGLVAISGSMLNLIMATFWETLALMGVFPEFFHFLAFLNLYYAVWQLLPFPKLDGILMFFATRMWYLFIFATLVGYILLYSLHFYSLIFAAIIGFVIMMLYYVTFEYKATV